MSNRQNFDTTDVLRMEVEVEPTGLTNLISNPDGEFGAWGWITPVAGSYMASPDTQPRVLVYTSPTPSAASYFTSESMPVAAGQYAAASWIYQSGNGFHRARFEWLNSSYGVLSSSTPSAYISSAGTYALAPAQAPANTAFVRLRFDHYSTTGGANPTAGGTIGIRAVKVAKAATSGALGTSRTNLIPNPSIETATTGWTAGDSRSTISRSTAQAAVGSASLSLQRNLGTGNAFAYTTVPVDAGRDYVFQFRSRAGSTIRAPYSTVTFYDAGGVQVGGTNGKNHATNSSTSWTNYFHLATAPAGAVTARVSLLVYASAPEAHYFDSFMFTEGTDTPVYFDGATAASGTKTYGWNGTAHQSSSTMTDSTLGSLMSTNWRNVLGPAHEIKVERETLNLGTLTAEILDATLDPSQSDDLRPGRKVRLLTSADGLTWFPIFTGKATKLDVEYDEKSVPAKPPRISLVAVDATQSLAAARRPDGVATLRELPYLLEGAGVPWRINGSGDQVPTATIVSTNDNATALDQVAITRDSALGSAWVDAYGVLVAWDPTPDVEIPNPLFEVDTSGWTGGTSTSIARVTTPVYSSPGALRLTRNTSTGLASAITPTGTSGLPVLGGFSYGVYARFRAGSTSRTATVRMRYYNAAGTEIGNHATSGVIVSGAWTYVGGWGAPSPPATAYVAVAVEVAGAAVSEIHYVDDVHFYAYEPTISVDEDAYSDLDLSFSSEQCINSVTVKRLSWDPEDPTKTIETVHGPYEDGPSVAQWGRCAEEFTVHGISEANVAAYAAKILARNAQPVVQVNSVSMPVTEATHTMDRAQMGLGMLALVTNAAKGISQTLRVNKVTHRITPDKWMVDLGFEAPNSVASPVPTPPVQNNGTTVLPDTDWVAPTLVNGWQNYSAQGGSAAVWANAAYRRKNGIVYLDGLVYGGTGTVFVLPVGFRPRSGSHIFSSVTGSNTAGRTDVSGTDGQVNAAAGNNAFWTFAGISFPADN